MARTTHSKRHGCFTRRRVAPAPDIGIDQCGFITPVNFSALGLGFGFNGGVLLIEPRLDGFGALLVSFFDWLLRRKAPACQVVANSPNRQFDAVGGSDTVSFGSDFIFRKLESPTSGRIPGMAPSEASTFSVQSVKPKHVVEEFAGRDEK